MSEPNTLRAGDSATWSCDLPDYPPAAGWSLKHRVLWRSGAPADFGAVANGAGWSVTLTGEATAPWAPGPATLVRWVERGTEKVTLGSSPITILPDLTTAQAFDPRTDAERALADAKAALTAYTANHGVHVAEYTIAGRTMKFRAASEITELIDRLERDVAFERARAAAMSGVAAGRVVTRM